MTKTEICLYSTKGWRELISTQADIDGEHSLVAALTDRITEALYRTREVYYFRCAGSYSKDDGITITKDDPDVKRHELYHEEIEEMGLSTMEGLVLEEGSALVIDEVDSEGEERAAHHNMCSRVFIDKYKRVISEPDSPALRAHIIETARTYAFGALMLEGPDPRFSPWAYIADDAKYMLYYALCRSLCPTCDPEEVERAKPVYIEALRRVKESGSLQPGVDFLKDLAGREMSELYDFPAEHFDLDNPDVLLDISEGHRPLPGRDLSIKLYSSDEEAADIIKAVLEEFSQDRLDDVRQSSQLFRPLSEFLEAKTF
ncbi:MAG: hypothetical protein KJ574_03995 [Nanoarchaeota archaeon]|nr:hypothetical protein [Nanoarchaeota archaeon]